MPCHIVRWGHRALLRLRSEGPVVCVVIVLPGNWLGYLGPDCTVETAVRDRSRSGGRLPQEPIGPFHDGVGGLGRAGRAEVVCRGQHGDDPDPAYAGGGGYPHVVERVPEVGAVPSPKLGMPSNSRPPPG